MDNYLIYSGIAVLLFVIYRQSRRNKNDFDRYRNKTMKTAPPTISEPYEPVHVAEPEPIVDENPKPSIEEMKAKLNPNDQALYEKVIDALHFYADVDLFWRGKEHGWGLALKFDEGQSGHAFIIDGKIYGYYRKFTALSHGSYFQYKKIENEKDIAAFAKQVEYLIYINHGLRPKHPKGNH